MGVAVRLHHCSVSVPPIPDTGRFTDDRHRARRQGRHTGRPWQVFIDVIALAFLVFTATGLVLLQIHAAKRPVTWPAIAFGFAGPTIILIFFLHG